MAFDNNVVLVGNLTRDPELRFTQGGAASIMRRCVQAGNKQLRFWHGRATKLMQFKMGFVSGHGVWPGLRLADCGKRQAVFGEQQR